jgi:hypothetical protein
MNALVSQPGWQIHSCESQVTAGLSRSLGVLHEAAISVTLKTRGAELGGDIGGGSCFCVLFFKLPPNAARSSAFLSVCGSEPPAKSEPGSQPLKNWPTLKRASQFMDVPLLVLLFPFCPLQTGMEPLLALGEHCLCGPRGWVWVTDARSL